MAKQQSVYRALGRVSQLALTVGLVQMLVPGTVLAQDTPAASAARTDPDEIIVTARRREESAQKVPVAITALTAEMLQERRIVGGQDLQGQVPSLSVSAGGQSRDVETIAIRGQGTNYTAAPAVVTYLAEVPLVAGRVVTLQGTPGQFLDLANIQVLRGPQGTLFGRNSTGGAVLLEPSRPTDKFEGYVQVQAGNYRDREVEGVINVPISDTLKIRMAGRFVDREGFTKDVLTGTDYDNRHYYTGRLGVTWTPTDRIENYLMVTGTRSTSHGAGYVIGRYNTALLDGVLGSVGGCAGLGLGAGCSVVTDMMAAQAERGPRRVALGPSPLRSKISGWNVIDQLKVELNDTLTLRNIISYGELRALSGFDGDGMPLAIYQTGMGTEPADNVRQFTEEFQLQGSALSDKFQYTAGVYYEHTGTPGSRLATNKGATFFSPSLSGGRYTTSAVALYAQAALDFGAFSDTLDGLKLTGGLRYTWDRYRGAGGTAALDDASNVVACTNGVMVVPTRLSDCALHARGRSSKPTWTIGLDYQATPDVLFYGKISRGYKTGGINLLAVNARNLTYNPEYVKTYEAGVKSKVRFGEGASLTLNADVFKTDYTNIQIAGADFNPVSYAGGAAVFNAASARIKGVELEAVLHLSRAIELSGSYSHMSSRYKSFKIDVDPLLSQLDCSGHVASGTIDLSCVPMPYLPKNQFNIAGRFTLPVPEEVGKLVFSAVYAYTGKQWQTATTVPEELPEAQAGGGEPGLLMKGYGVLNMSLNWSDVMQLPVDLTLFMTNVTNKTYRISNTGTYLSLGSQASLYGEPRMYGASVRYKF